MLGYKRGENYRILSSKQNIPGKICLLVIFSNNFFSAQHKKAEPFLTLLPLFMTLSQEYCDHKILIKENGRNPYKHLQSDKYMYLYLKKSF